MSDEKPLHVQVAEALGWIRLVIGSRADHLRFQKCLEGGRYYWCDPAGQVAGCETCDGYPPHYDTDWSATGPLIEKYGLVVFEDPLSGPNWEAQAPRWRTQSGTPCANCGAIDFENPHATGAAPLIAVCHLILALKEAGKL